jgi:cell wall assembly regulator SMI1
MDLWAKVSAFNCARDDFARGAPTQEIVKALVQKGLTVASAKAAVAGLVRSAGRGRHFDLDQLDAKDREPISNTWVRIEAYLARKAPEFLKDLGSGASAEEVEATEEQLREFGHRLPAPVIASYATHNGSCYFLGDWEVLFALHELTDSWYSLKGLDVTHWYSPAWVPFTGSVDLAHGHGHLFLDLDPSEQKKGRIIQWGGWGFSADVVAPSFESWLNQYAEKLEAGDYDDVIAERRDLARQYGEGNS